jgi:hypothetical protein
MIDMGIEASLDIFQKKKKERIAYLVHELLERGGEADLNEFKGSVAVHWGIRQKTQDEYIQDLKSAGAINVHENKIILNWEKEKAEEWLKRQGIKTKPSK